MADRPDTPSRPSKRGDADTPSRPSKRGDADTPSRPSKRGDAPARPSSAKKVAAASRRSRGRGPGRERPKLGFPLAIVAICVLGVLTVAFSRSERIAYAENAEPPLLSDHWHAAYGIYVCDGFEPPLLDARDSRTGIHTHGDGLIHIHPFGKAASGYNARLGVWADTIGFDLGNDGFTLPGGESYRVGSAECGGEPAGVYVIRWADAFDPTVPGEVFTSGFRDIRIRDDKSAFVLAVVPESRIGDVPRPDSIATLSAPPDLTPEEQRQQQAGIESLQQEGVDIGNLDLEGFDLEDPAATGSAGDADGQG